MASALDRLCLGFLMAALTTASLVLTATAVRPAPPAGGSTPGSNEVDGVPLIPITRAQRAQCQNFANELNRSVPCPSLLPDPIPVSDTSVSGVSCLATMSCGPASISVSRTSFFLTQMNFQVPNSYIGVSIDAYQGPLPAKSTSGGPLGHFVFMTGPDLGSTLGAASEHMNRLSVPPYCARVRTSKPLSVHGSPATLFQCSDASVGLRTPEIYIGHELLEWTSAGIVCQVSFHGHSLANIALDIAVADATQLVVPKKTRVP